MDWIHCNICYLQPGDVKDRKFELTNCGHIYCNMCVAEGTKEKCKVCNTRNCTTILLTSQMKPDVQQFFTDPQDTLKKMFLVMDFQRGHRHRLTSHNREVVKQFQAARQELAKQNSQIVEMKTKIRELERDLEHLKIVSSSTSNTSPGSFTRPSPPPTWSCSPNSSQANLLQKMHISSQQPRSTFSQSDGWVTPNRLTLKRTPPNSSSLNRQVRHEVPLPNRGRYSVSPGTLYRNITPPGAQNHRNATPPGSQNHVISPRPHSRLTPPGAAMTAYRLYPEYSSQPSTPGTPATPTFEGRVTPNMPCPASMSPRISPKRVLTPPSPSSGHLSKSRSQSSLSLLSHVVPPMKAARPNI